MEENYFMREKNKADNPSPKSFMDYVRSINPVYYYLLFSLFAVVLLVHMFTGQWINTPNTYNSFALQAKSWLEGRLDLGENYSYLEIAEYNGKYFISFPPFVSYVLLPFAIIFGERTPDNLIAVICYLVAAVYAVKLFRKIRGTYNNAFIFAFLLLGASNVIFCSVNGWVWFIAQNFAFTLSLMSIYYATCGKLGLSLSFLACAVGCRPFQIVYIPLLLVIYFCGTNTKNFSFVKFVKEKWTCAIAPFLIGLSYMILNYMRFDNVFEFGHNYLPEFVEAENGQFSFQYALQNLPSLFRLPAKADNGALVFPSFNGVAVWLVSPIVITFIIYFVYSIVKRKKLEEELTPSFKKRNSIVRILLPCLMILHIFFIISHKTMGGWHWGNRYINDVLPFMFYGLLLFLPKKESLYKFNIPLCVYGACINVLGAVITYNNWSF